MLNPWQLPFLVEAILMSTAMLFGYLLHRKGKPYGKVKLVVHLFFFLWLSVGFGFISYGYFSMKTPGVILIPVIVMGLCILAQLVIGIAMLASRQAGKKLPLIHTMSAILLVLASLSGLFIESGRR